MPWIGGAIAGGGALLGGLAGALGAKGGKADYSLPDEMGYVFGESWPMFQGLGAAGARSSRQPNLGAPMMGAPPMSQVDKISCQHRVGMTIFLRK
jgi:hypothetical protein